MLCRRWEFTQQRAAQKMPSGTTTACVSLLVFFRIRRGTFPYGVEDDASTISQTPTTHHTSTTCVKLTIVTHLSFSERIAVANLSYLYVYYWVSLRPDRLMWRIQQQQHGNYPGTPMVVMQARQHSFGTTLRFIGPVPADSRQWTPSTWGGCSEGLDAFRFFLRLR